MSNQKNTLDLSNLSREDLEQALREVFTLADVLVGAKDPEWENNCPEWADNGNIDDIWEAGQNNGEAFTAAVFKGIIERKLNGEAVGDGEG